MKIHLARDGTSLGVFSEIEIRAGLAEGRFRSTDLAWREGMPAWTALREWGEFTDYPKSSSSEIPRPYTPTDLPWEMTPGLKSLLSSAWQLVVRPTVLSNARLQAGSVFGAAYLAIGILFIPFVLLSPISSKVESVRFEFFAKWLAEQPSAEISQFGQQMLTGLQQQDPAAWLAGCTAACGLILMPFFSAFIGNFLWLGLRIQGLKAPYGRTLLATIFTSQILWLVVFPLQVILVLMGLVAPMATWLPTIFLGFVTTAFFCRATGAALVISGWRVALSGLIWFSLICFFCCCCSCLGMLLAAGR